MTFQSTILYCLFMRWFWAGSYPLILHTSFPTPKKPTAIIETPHNNPNRTHSARQNARPFPGSNPLPRERNKCGARPRNQPWKPNSRKPAGRALVRMYSGIAWASRALPSQQGPAAAPAKSKTGDFIFRESLSELAPRGSALPRAQHRQRQQPLRYNSRAVPGDSTRLRSKRARDSYPPWSIKDAAGHNNIASGCCCGYTRLQRVICMHVRAAGATQH